MGDQRPDARIRVSLTQTLLIAKFKWQDTGSFVADSYGGGMRIIVDRRNRLLHVDLSGFRSTVTVSNFSVFRYESGPRPSETINLGCLWSIPNGNYGKQARWNTDGTITVIGGLANGDRCIHTPVTMPIPDGVTFR